MTRKCPFEKGVIRNSLLNPYKAKQTLERDSLLSFETLYSFDSLQNDKFLHRSKLKPFADDKTNVTKKLKFVMGRVENIVGKGVNVSFPAMFRKSCFLRVINPFPNTPF